MAKAGKMSESEDVTGNRAIDALLFQKREAAKQKNIHWDCELQVPNNNRIREFDLCVLLGNILDNAIEACERMPEGEERLSGESVGVENAGEKKEPVIYTKTGEAEHAEQSVNLSVSV